MSKSTNEKKPILKYSLLGCGTLIIVGVLILTLYILSLFKEPDTIEMLSHHPFKSVKAKEKYLKYYEKRSQTGHEISVHFQTFALIHKKTYTFCDN